MSCVFHPDRESVCACVRCGRLLCDECKEVRDGRIYCSSCALGVVAEVAAETTGSSNLSWFGRHLNWTMVLAYFCGGVVLAISAAIAVETESISALVVIGLMVFLGMCIVWGWALRRKGRSLWWILLFLFLQIFGLLIFFYLENREDRG